MVSPATKPKPGAKSETPKKLGRPKKRPAGASDGRGKSSKQQLVHKSKARPGPIPVPVPVPPGDGSLVDYTAGNSLWEAAIVQGRCGNPSKPPRKYASADDLWDDVVGYFRWAESHPMGIAETKTFRDDSWVQIRPVPRPFTLHSLCTFLGITTVIWRRWANPHDPLHRPDLVSAIARAEEIIRSQKLEGALIGLYDAKLTSRLLGLSDHIDVSNNVTIKIDKSDADL